MAEPCRPLVAFGYALLGGAVVAVSGTLYVCRRVMRSPF